MSQPLSGKRALVTGGSRGIGAAIARRLARDGAAVAINYARSKDAAEALVREIEAAGGKAYAVQGDVATPDGRERLVEGAVSALGGLDILVNNAGVFEALPLAETDDAHIQRQFDVNVTGVIATTRLALKHLKEGGRIINTSSVVARGAMAGASVYSATKAAVETFTKALAAELGPAGISVNAVAPGLTQTDMVPESGDFVDAMVKQTPLGRLGRADDIAPAVAFLAGPDGAWITGHVIDAAGGLRV